MRRGISLFLGFTHKGIPRFARNDTNKGFFRNLLSITTQARTSRVARNVSS